MPHRVGLVAGEFVYQRQFEIADGLGTVLVGDVVGGTVAPRMHLQIGCHSIPVLGVEAYGAGDRTYGLLVLTHAVRDGLDVEHELREGGKTFPILLTLPLAKSPEDTTLGDAFGPLLATALDIIGEEFTDPIIKDLPTEN